MRGQTVRLQEERGSQGLCSSTRPPFHSAPPPEGRRPRRGWAVGGLARARSHGCSLLSRSCQDLPLFHTILQNFLTGSLPGYQSTVEPFRPDQDVKEAGTRMKTLVDTLPHSTRRAVLRLSEKIVKTSVCA
ncbi:uteroglobin [Heterocephalus glaber]|uniref:Uteroglobin n=1 Tax=Heterocephalus glaber TaxID=10181 RepID=A0AAX6SFA8_HETGA|nr:uteroglobin [Heterocephalus glaber]